MKVLFTYSLSDVYDPKRPLYSFENIHIGISYLSSSLKSKGHATRLLILPCEDYRKSIGMMHECMNAYSPDIVAFTAVATQYPFISKMAGYIKNNWPDRLLVAGGSYVSLCPEEALRDSFDVLCIGEGEEPIVELAEQISHTGHAGKIQNLWIKQRPDSVDKNSTREFRKNLDSLPFPDREMWKPWVQETVRSRHVVLLGRGCPFSCTYCCNHALRKIAPGKYVRYRSPKNIVEEIRYVRARYSHSEDIYLQAETIMLDKDWLLILCEALERLNGSYPKPIKYSCNFRIGDPELDDNIYAALRKANITTLEIGLESGSERLRNEVLRRHYTNAQFLEAVRLARKYGMKVILYNIIGLPTETKEEHLQTVAINRIVCPDDHRTGIYFPYPGTDLIKYCREQGLLKDYSLSFPEERKRAVLDMPDFSKKEIQRAYLLFDWRIYSGTRTFIFRFRRLVRNYLRAHGIFSRHIVGILPYWHRIQQIIVSSGSRLRRLLNNSRRGT